MKNVFVRIEHEKKFRVLIANLVKHVICKYEKVCLFSQGRFMKPLTSVNLAHEEQIRSLGIGLEKFAHVPPFRVVDDRLGRRHWKKKKKGKRKRMGNNDEANTSIEVTLGEGVQRRGRNDFFEGVEVVIVGRDYANTPYSPSFIARFPLHPPFRLVRVVPSPPKSPHFPRKTAFSPNSSPSPDKFYSNRFPVCRSCKIENERACIPCGEKLSPRC